MPHKYPRRVKSLEKLSGVWVLLITFSLGLTLALLLPQHPWLPPGLAALLYLFLEFLPLLFFIFTITQPTLSIGLIFPIVTVIIMMLPITIFIRRRFPNYRKIIRNSQLYRKVTNTKTVEEIEQEIIARRKEQIKNTIITDKSYEQFIYVNRAANKWRKKVEKRKEAEKSALLSEGNVTLNIGYALDPVVEENRDQPQGAQDSGLVNGGYNSLPRHDQSLNRIENGKMVTDV